MRIIAGQFRSRTLKSLPGLNTRPTPDRLREALFNVLQSIIGGATFLDAYAGTGAVGIEALSRGAAQAIFIEQGKAAVDVIRENLRALGVASQAEVLQGRVLKYLAQRSADIVFLDPPYDLLAEYHSALDILGAKQPLVAIAQHSCRIELRPAYGNLERIRVLRQGDNTLSFYKPQHSNSHTEESPDL